MLDIPDEVRNKVVAEGNAGWLDELPSVVASLAEDWSLTIGGALLLERLGAAIFDVVPDPATRHDVMGDVVARLWRPVGPDVDLPTGADKARAYADLLPRLWEETGRACSEATVADALACLGRRRRAHDDRHAVLVHGDVHDLNVLRAADGTFKLIDPDGLRAERAFDLGTIIRCNPGTGDELHARAKRLAERTGV